MSRLFRPIAGRPVKIDGNITNPRRSTKTADERSQNKGGRLAVVPAKDWGCRMVVEIDGRPTHDREVNSGSNAVRVGAATLYKIKGSNLKTKMA